ncbi:hypothetical protein RJ640_000374 [Escallonia rubra]|uniref:Uncharacterized protein n=1 Tax=Escallonia rubra TaxID=112253 RepID=A0AA88QZK3_9ASTE|nr:hypothetical protein RJ640_000374 [Escallonia rubra]
MVPVPYPVYAKLHGPQNVIHNFTRSPNSAKQRGGKYVNVWLENVPEKQRRMHQRGNPWEIRDGNRDGRSRQEPPGLPSEKWLFRIGLDKNVSLVIFMIGTGPKWLFRIGPDKNVSLGSSKAYATTLITKMVTLKYSESSGVREHILRLNDMPSQLKGLDMEISKGFLVHFITTSLPAQFAPFKINYNTQEEKWKMSELIFAIFFEDAEYSGSSTPRVINLEKIQDHVSIPVIQKVGAPLTHIEDNDAPEQFDKGKMGFDTVAMDNHPVEIILVADVELAMK